MGKLGNSPLEMIKGLNSLTDLKGGLRRFVAVNKKGQKSAVLQLGMTRTPLVFEKLSFLTKLVTREMGGHAQMTSLFQL